MLAGVTTIFLDAGGTLFRLRGTIGKIYSDIARRYGVQIRPELIDRKFHHEYRVKDLNGLPLVHKGDLIQIEKQWWCELVRLVMADSIPPGAFMNYFIELYEFFGTSEAWELYPDAEGSLKKLRDQGFRLAVISNFDSRLRKILANLGIKNLFEMVTTSWEAGAAKPDVRIFKSALNAMRISPQQALHVGDSIREDFEGAKASSLTPVLLDRHGIHPQWKEGWRIGSLADLCRSL
jgi:putative hydrolase of the HAD superfamily